MIVYRELSSIEKDLGFSAKTLYGLSNSLEKHYHIPSLPSHSVILLCAGLIPFDRAFDLYCCLLAIACHFTRFVSPFIHKSEHGNKSLLLSKQAGYLLDPTFLPGKLQVPDF